MQPLGARWLELADILEYQRRARKTRFARDADAYFLGLIGEVGSIFSAHKKSIRSSANPSQIRAELREEIGDAIWYLAAIASEYGVRLDDVLEYNLKKTTDYFLGKRVKYFDSTYPKHEQIPRVIGARFIRISGSKVRMIVNGQPLGDDIDDNATKKPDGYRFHDVFHLSFATFLGWSPVLRSLMKIKRKSRPLIDNAQDGARAAAIEEAISAFIFAEQHRYGGFNIADNIPFRTMEIIKRVTSSLEVGARTIPDWQKAISVGFKMFERLKANNGGYVRADLRLRKMTYRP